MRPSTDSTSTLNSTPKSPSKGPTAPLVTNKGCLSCKYNPTSIMTEMVKCATCEQHFHAICRDRRGIPTKSSICPITFLKPFLEISGHYRSHKDRLGQFQYVCDACAIPPQPNSSATQTLISGALYDAESNNTAVVDDTQIVDILSNTAESVSLDASSVDDLIPNVQVKSMLNLQKQILARIDLLCNTSSVLETSVCDQFTALKEQLNSLPSTRLDEEIHPSHIHTDAPTPIEQPVSPRETTKPFTDLHDDVLCDDEKHSLYSFLEALEDLKTIKSSSSNSSRDILYFGEFSYRYGNIEHPAKPFPPEIKKVIDKINKLYPESSSNSCLVTKYSSGVNGIPLHTDNEPFISPWSDIMTLSLGCPRKMTFESADESSTQSLELRDNSLLVFSRKSQEFWKHGIHPDTSSTVRYSLTFRQLAPYFLNSTAIIGDSNTERLSFGTGRKTFGKWLPGIRIKAGRIKDIPDPEGLYPFRNVVFHCGINDLRSRDGAPNPEELARTLNNKCLQYTKMFPKMRVHLSLVLPTKDPILNRHVYQLNNILTSMARNLKNVSVISHEYLAFSDGTLRPQLGRRNRDGSPFQGDTVHLGYTGTIQFSQTLKNAIIKPKDGVTRKPINNSSVRLPEVNTSGYHYFNPNPDYINSNVSNSNKHTVNQWFQGSEGYNNSLWNRDSGPHSSFRDNIYYGY